MLMLPMPTTFGLGDTARCRINGAEASVTWRDRDTLVVNGMDTRRILFRQDDDRDAAGTPIRTFWCGDATDDADAPTTIHLFGLDKQGRPLELVCANRLPGENRAARRRAARGKP